MDIWYQAYEIVLEKLKETKKRYKSAQEAIRILQKEVGNLKSQLSEKKPLPQNPETIQRLRERIRGQKDEINRLTGLLDKRCGKIRIYNEFDADDFAEYISSKRDEEHEKYFCSGCECYHIRHKKKHLRGKAWGRREKTVT